MKGMPARRLADPSALVASVALHAVLLGGGAWFLARSLGPGTVSEPVDRTVEVTVVEEGLRHSSECCTQAGQRDGTVVEPGIATAGAESAPEVQGGVLLARPELDRAGRGGTRDSRDQALNLADSVDGVTLNRAALDRRDRSQLQRLQTAVQRRSRDDRRATPNPMQLTFVASGDGRRHERRPSARFDPDQGRRTGALPSRLGGRRGGSDPGPGWGEPEGNLLDGTEPRPAAGVVAGRSLGGHRRAAAVVHARPAVKLARAAVPAPTHGHPNDNVDSYQEVATTVQSLIHASAAGGQLGPGPGGETGPGRPASGGETGVGSWSAPSGRGGSGEIAYDPRFSGYHSRIISHLDRFWSRAFPAWAVAEGRGGMAIVELTLARDGAVARVRVVRPSGIPEFDRNLLAAVQQAAPFEPLPSALAPVHRVSIQFDATNPAVGRDGP